MRSKLLVWSAATLPVALLLVGASAASGCAQILGFYRDSAADTCTTDSECAPDETCMFQKCTQECSLGHDCAPGYRCLQTATRAACVRTDAQPDDGGALSNGGASASGGGGGAAGADHGAAGAAVAGQPGHAPDAGVGGANPVGPSAPECEHDADCAVTFTTEPGNCAEGYCDSGHCRFRALDADGDGHRASLCKSGTPTVIESGDDCDDTNPGMYKGAWDGPASGTSAQPDSCDGVDNDCSGKPDDATFTDAQAHTHVCSCISGTKSDCGSALGAKGNCTMGSAECAAGSWGPCSIQPAAADKCSPGDDATCDGDVNVGCACSKADQTVPCGACGDGTKTCDTASGTYAACQNAYMPGGTCTASNGCPGTLDCARACNTTAKPSQSCTASNGCPGTTNCSNQCVSTGTPNQTCVASNGCPGTTNCSNQCVTSATPNQTCTASNGCSGKTNCSGQCITSGNPNQDCTASNGCKGKTDCSGNCGATQGRGNWVGGMDKGSVGFKDGSDCSGGGCAAGQFNVVGSPQFSGRYTFYFQTGQTGNVDNTSNIQTMRVYCTDGSSQVVLTGNQLCSGGQKSCPPDGYASYSISCPWGTSVGVAKLLNAGGGCCGGYDKTVYGGQVVVASGICQ